MLQPRIMKLGKISSAWSLGGVRKFSSSLYATKRHPSISERTNLVFHQCKWSDHDRVVTTIDRWMGDTKAKENLPRVGELFEDMHSILKSLHCFVQREGVTSAPSSSRHVWLILSRENESIEAMAYGRTFNAGGCSVFGICGNPNALPFDIEQLNACTTEGADSVMVRKLITEMRGQHAFDFHLTRLQQIGCGHIIKLEKDNSQDTEELKNQLKKLYERNSHST